MSEEVKMRFKEWLRTVPPEPGPTGIIRFLKSPAVQNNMPPDFMAFNQLAAFIQGQPGWGDADIIEAERLWRLFDQYHKAARRPR